MTLEQLQTENLELREQVQTLTAQHDVDAATIADLQKQVGELQAHNQKLFLMATRNVTGDENEDDEPEEKPVMSIAEMARFFANRRGK